MDSPFVLKLNNGTRVGVFCEEVDGWYRILYGNYRGYVSKDYVFLPSTDMLVGNVLNDGTPVYLNAGEFSEAVDTLAAGTGLTITSMQGDYYGVEYEVGIAAADGMENAQDGPQAEEAGGEAFDTTPVVSDAGAVEGQYYGGAPKEQEAAEAQGAQQALTETQYGAEAKIKRGYIKQDAVNTSASKNAANMIKEGMKGVEVNKLQRERRERGFLGAAATGEFGEQTKKAVVLFQEFAGLDADGIAGAKTLEMLYGDNDIRCTYAQRMGISGEVRLTPWEEMQDIYYKGCTAKDNRCRNGAVMEHQAVWRVVPCGCRACFGG